MRGFVGQTRSRALIARLSALGVGEATQPREMPPRRAPWFLDNGAFAAWRAGKSFDATAFERALAMSSSVATRPEWVVVPDVVGDAAATIALAREWLPRLRALGFRCALAVQDGMTPETFPLWGEIDVIFVGGTLKWKLANAHAWSVAAHEHGVELHIGRVGSARRVEWAASILADSIDSCVPLWSADQLRVWHAALVRGLVQMSFPWSPPTPPPAREMRL